MRGCAIILAGLLGLALAGCAGPNDRLAMDRDRCKAAGYRPDTEAFVNCMHQQSRQRDPQFPG